MPNEDTFKTNRIDVVAAFIAMGHTYDEVKDVKGKKFFCFQGKEKFQELQGKYYAKSIPVDAYSFHREYTDILNLVKG